MPLGHEGREGRKMRCKCVRGRVEVDKNMS